MYHPADGEGASNSLGQLRWKCVGAVQRLVIMILRLTCTLHGMRASLTLSQEAGRVDRTASPCPRPSCAQDLSEDVGVWTGGLVPLPPVRSMPESDSTQTANSPTTPILERARKLAGLWVVDDNRQDAYLAWMEFCQDWARHRLKQIYFERDDGQSGPTRERTNPAYVAQWAWENAPHVPPYRTTAELDRMAYDICEEAWDHGRDVREVLVSLVRRLQWGGLLPRWFYQAVVG